MIAFVNGRLVPASEAFVSSFDFGFLYGVGLFETFRTWNGKLFAFERHLKRLEFDLMALGWQLPFGTEMLANWTKETVKANRQFLFEGCDLRLRITVTPGIFDHQKGWWDLKTSEPTVVIHATPLPPNFDQKNDLGWQAIFAPWRRPKEFPLWKFKATNYFANVLARQHAKSQGADEAIWLNSEGNLTEGTATNLFVICNGELITPPPDEGLLAGVMRSLVIETADELGLKVCEKPLPIEILNELEEAFVTNAVMGVVPLTKIEGRVLDSKTLTMQIRYAILAKAQNWGTDVLG
ncbi:MAG: aminotransferase class IV [Armatimonadetes bacterium]|nr:aminotransferase class IV [Armatimonadota bacterium]MDW8029388.1 aminotransferase class IV [Armatimonadota bacterium]